MLRAPGGRPYLRGRWADWQVQEERPQMESPGCSLGNHRKQNREWRGEAGGKGQERVGGTGEMEQSDGMSAPTGSSERLSPPDPPVQRP